MLLPEQTSKHKTTINRLVGWVLMAVLLILSVTVIICTFVQYWILLARYPSRINQVVATPTPEPSVTPNLLSVEWSQAIGQFAGIKNGRAYIYNNQTRAIEVLRLDDGEVERQQVLNEDLSPIWMSIINDMLIIVVAVESSRPYPLMRGLDLQTFDIKWEISGVGKPSEVGDRIYKYQIDSDDNFTLLVIDPKDGSLSRHKIPDFENFELMKVPADSTQPILVANYRFAEERVLTAIDPENGRQLWRYGPVLLKNNMGGEFYIPYMDGKAIFLATSKQLCKLETANGQEHWCIERKDDLPLLSPPTNGRMFIKPAAARVAILDTNTGRQIWEMDQSASRPPSYFGATRVAIVDGVAYFSLTDNRNLLRAVSINEAKLLWEHKMPMYLDHIDVLTATERYLYLHFPDSIKQVDRTNGELIGQINDHAKIHEYVGVKGEHLYVVGQRGTVEPIMGDRLDVEGHYLTAFGKEPPEKVATHALKLWKTGNRSGGLRTMRLLLADLPPNIASPVIAQTCREMIEGELQAAQTKFEAPPYHGQYHEVLDTLARFSPDPLVLLVKKCPQADDLIVATYTLAEMVHVASETGIYDKIAWLDQPIENPYLAELSRILPESPEVQKIRTEQEERMRKWVFTIEWQRLPLVIVGIGLPLLVASIGLIYPQWRWGLAIFAFILLVMNACGGGPLFNSIISGIKSTSGEHLWGLNVQLAQLEYLCGSCMLFFTSAVSLLVTKSNRVSFIVLTVLIYIVNTIIMFLLLGSPFHPYSY